MTKFKIGDRVKVVRYGQKVVESKTGLNHPLEPTVFPVYYQDDTVRIVDLNPKLKGKESFVSHVSNDSYKIHGHNEWLDAEQLELAENTEGFGEEE